MSWGTQVTLKAIPPAGKAVDQGAMNKAKSIMFSRINSSGFVGASVVQQGSNEIVVSVPHENAQQVAKLVGTTAQLNFRQVLLGAPNFVAASTPSPSPSTSTKASSLEPSTTPSSSSSPKPSSSGGTGQAAGASAIRGQAASATPSPSVSASPSSSPKASASPSASSSGTLSTTADGLGNASALTPQTVADFNKLNCANSSWQIASLRVQPQQL